MRHIAIDARGKPLGVLIGPANRHDSHMLAPTLDAVPSVRNGRPADRDDDLASCTPCEGYDYRRCRREGRVRGIQSRIARRGLDNSNASDITAGWWNARTPG